MRLYFSPGACSLAPHIILRELGGHFDLDLVDLKAKKTAEDKDFLAINPKGYVPALQLDDEQVLTEVPAIMQYLADRAPEKGLAPAPGTLARYRLVEIINFISAEIHKTFSPLFAEGMPEEARRIFLDRLSKRVDFIAMRLESSPYLLGDHFSIADAYLFTVLSWSRYVKFDLGAWPAVVAYLARIAQRPSVHDAMAAEGLIKQ
ncbi:MAG TPA: glutathione transferase GstA [Burkholderiaceae bacterium]